MATKQNKRRARRRAEREHTVRRQQQAPPPPPPPPTRPRLLLRQRWQREIGCEIATAMAQDQSEAGQRRGLAMIDAVTSMPMAEVLLHIRPYITGEGCQAFVRALDAAAARSAARPGPVAFLHVWRRMVRGAEMEETDFLQVIKGLCVLNGASDGYFWWTKLMYGEPPPPPATTPPPTIKEEPAWQ